MNELNDATTPESIAQEASAPGKFSLIARLQERNMPTEDVSIFIDDASAWEVFTLEEEAAGIFVVGTEEEKAARQAELEEVERKIEAAKQRVLASRVVFTLRAVSNKRYDELIEEARKSFPVKYEKITNPLTNRVTLEEIASEDRETLFNQLFIAECIVKVTMGNDVDDEITPEWVALFTNEAPLDALRVVTTQAYKMRMAGEWMDAYQNEDFSPKP